MTWSTRLAALAAAFVVIFPSVASAYYWYGGTTYGGYMPTTGTAVSASRAAAPTSQAAATMSAPKTTATTSATNSVEQTLLRLTNQERIKHGLSPLQVNSSLTSLARMKSKDMVAKNYFSHTSPTYGSPAQMLTRYGVTYSYYAENIAQGADAAGIHARWMSSAAHRANILSSRVTYIGVGVAPDGSGYTATQLFIAR
ncbi:MAG TPA: CAP domain-containing protein [Symbiobacteriaceae bacterium]|nr:CAP domain-containing protein [Symbiobacteriaceae bacterium]